MGLYKTLVRPVIFRTTSDYAHETTLKVSAYLSQKKWVVNFSDKIFRSSDPALKQKIWGLSFRNPVGLAAGFDKNGTSVKLMEAIGFGFVEIGSVTAKASPGNPKPRSFRLPQDLSIINRMGLNNDGAKTVIKRLKKQKFKIPVGINIAKTHDPSIGGKGALRDYKYSFDLAKNLADYITINISCPNTEEGKTFEDAGELDKLLEYLKIGSDSSDPPVLIKLSADVSVNQLHELLDVCESYAVSGYVAVNTSAERVGLNTSGKKIESIGKGGLSGRAIREKSTDMIREVFEYTKGDKRIIGAGGIFTAEDAIEKFKAGADLLQIYTGLVYEGPGLVKKINAGISNYLEEEGLDHIYQIRKGRKTEK